MEKIQKRITINASASKVWKALTDKDELRRKDLQMTFGMDFGEPGQRDLDII